jgi:Rieske Fe-S protein
VVKDDGTIEKYGINAVCTHLGCVVPWVAVSAWGRGGGAQAPRRCAKWRGEVPALPPCIYGAPAATARS